MKKITKRQRQIIDASIDLIAERSISALTIKNIAQEVELTEGAIYRHFASKKAILLGILQLFHHTAEKTLVECCQSDSAALDQIEEIFTRHVSFFCEKPAVTAVIFSESIFQNNNELSMEVYSLMKMHEKALHCIVKRGRKNNEILCDIGDKEIIRLVIGSIRYTVTKWNLSSYDFDLKLECSLVLAGLNKMLATH